MTKWFLALASAAMLAACSSSEPPDDRPAAGASAARPACDGTLRVTNASSRPIRQLHFADSALSSFGRDRLGTDMLAVGQSRDFRADGPGPHDFRVMRLDGSTSDLRRAEICTGTQIVITNYGIERR